MDIVRYTPEPLEGGGTISPSYLAALDLRQEWHDPDDGTFVGVAPGLDTLDAAGLLARAQDIHARHPIIDPDTGSPYTDEGLEAAVTAWISAAGA